MDGDRLIGSLPIPPGPQKLSAPIGTWKIVGIATTPWFRWDEAMLNHGERSEWCWAYETGRKRRRQWQLYDCFGGFSIHLRFLW
jgi:hypothetical protein